MASCRRWLADTSYPNGHVEDTLSSPPRNKEILPAASSLPDISDERNIHHGKTHIRR